MNFLIYESICINIIKSLIPHSVLNLIGQRFKTSLIALPLRTLLLDRSNFRIEEATQILAPVFPLLALTIRALTSAIP